MNSIRTVLLAILLSILAAAQAQNIGINANGAAPAASALLDIDATALPAANKRGLLIPRIALASRNNAAPVVAPAASLVIYNTATAGTAPNNVAPGFYYWDGVSQWLRMYSGNDAWSTTGNSGTTAGTNFIGTTDAKDFVVKTGGSATGNERMRVQAAGQTVVNRVSAATGDVFSVYATGSSGALGSLGDVAIAGYASGNGIGVWGESVSNSGSTDGVGGFFRHSSPFTPNDNFSAGVVANNSSDPLNASNGAICYGLIATASGWPGSNGGSTIGAMGSAPGPNSATGIVGQGGGTNTYYTMVEGSGASFTANEIGSISFGLSATSGIGAIGLSDASNGIYTPTRGAGMLGIGNQLVWSG